MLTQEELQTKLDYDKVTGNFYWRTGPLKGKLAGCKCGTLPDQGYWEITISKKRYKAHRLAWLYVYGTFPEKVIDHIDHDRTNNRIDNLREANIHVNSKNKTLYHTNKSGYPGVDRHGDNWKARIGVNGTKVLLGVFSTFEEAVAAKKAGEKLLAYHNNHGNRKSLTTIPHTIKGSTPQANGGGNSEGPE
jgi:hypothetical protein